MGRIVTALLAAAGLWLGGSDARAQGGAERTLDELRERLGAQERELEALRRELERLATPGATEPLQSGDGAGSSGGGGSGGVASGGAGAGGWGPFTLEPFAISGWNGAWRLGLEGRLHLDGRFVLDPGRGDYADGFEVRRGRFGFELTLYEILEARLSLEGGRTRDTDLRDAYVRLRPFPWFELWAGQTLLPYSPERLTSANHIDHAERTMIVASLVGQREVGVMARGLLPGGFVGYALGIFNGEGQNVALEELRDDRFDLVGRLEVMPLGDRRLRLGSSLIHSPPREGRAELEVIRTVGDQITPFLVYALDRRRGDRFRAEGDARLGFEVVELSAELHVDRQEDVLSSSGSEGNLTNWGWFVNLSGVLGGTFELQELGGVVVVPRAPLYDPRTSTYGPGALQLALRYEELRADERTVERGYAAGAELARAVTSSLHWFLWRTVRFTLSYTYTDLERGRAIVDGEGISDEHALIGRITVYF